MSLFLDQLAETLRREQETAARPTSEEIARSAAQHGGELRRAGFTVAQVVHDYGDVCQAVTELAIELAAPDLRRRVQDPQPVPRRGHRAGGHRVRPPARAVARGPRNGAPGLLRARAPEPAGQRDPRLRGPEERDGRDRRQHGRVLGRNLIALRDLIDRSLAEVRLEAGLHRREHVPLDRAHGRGRAGGGDRSQDPGPPAHGHARGARGRDRRGSAAASRRRSPTCCRTPSSSAGRTDTSC